MSETRTVDKISFKVNIPIIAAIITGSCTVYGAFASLRTDLKLFSAKLDTHIEAQIVVANKITGLETKTDTMSSKIADIDKRVYRLEKSN